MIQTLFTLVLAATLALSQSLQVNSPAGVTQCGPTLLSWSGGAPPYYLSVLPGNQPSAAPLETLLSDTTQTQYTWTVDLAAGTSITIQIKDSTGSINYSSATTIGAGNTKCVGKSGSSASAGSSATGKSTAAGLSTVAARLSSAVSAATTSIAVVTATPSFVATVTSTTSPATSATSAVNSTKAASAQSNKVYLPLALVGGLALIL